EMDLKTFPRPIPVTCWLRCAVPFLLLALPGILAVPRTVLAQQPAPVPGEDRALIQQLLQRVNDLEAQVKALQAERSKAGAPAPAPIAPPVIVPEAPAETTVRPESSRLQLRGF